MVTAGKILIGFMAGVAPIATLATISSLGLLSSSSKKTELPEKECYLIEAVSNNQDKFLICKSNNYYLHNTSEKKPYQKVKGFKIQKDKEIVVVLEGEGTAEKNKTLTAKEETNWKEFIEQNKELNNQNMTCSISSSADSQKAKNDSWTCEKNESTATKKSLKLSKLSPWTNK